MTDLDQSAQSARLNNVYRYLHDPEYHHAVDLLARLVLHAVEQADLAADRNPQLDRRELRLRAMVDALLGLEEDTEPDRSTMIHAATILPPE